MVDFVLKLFNKFKRFITFGFVGCINTLVDFAAFTIALNLFAMSPSHSQALGYACGLACSFVLNKRFTFRDHTSEQLLQLIAFLAVNGVSWFVSTTLIERIINLGINVYIAKPIVTGIVMLINYFGYKSLVFKAPNKQEGDEAN